MRISYNKDKNEFDLHILGFNDFGTPEKKHEMQIKWK